MTTAELLAMPAGRELDAIVASRVMGWASADVDTAMLCASGSIAACSEMTTGHVPDYSTDIAAAWLVVERIHEHGHAITVERWLGNPELGKWSAAFTLENGHDTGQCVAESAPLAICRAALVAAGMAKT